MYLDTLLTAEVSDSLVVAIARVALSLRHSPAECPLYLSFLSDALAAEPPPFSSKDYAAVYEEASADARWMAVSLMTNAEREGDGATRLWSLSACSSDTRIREQLKAHAVDESRHALLYLALLDLAFPGSVDQDFRRELQQLSPHYSMTMEVFAVPGSPYAKEPTIDDFIQMNIAEIRTTIHHLMQRRALLGHSPPAHQTKMQRILDALLRDELNHVAYTAVIIDELARRRPLPEAMHIFTARVRDFNEITNRELDQRIFD